jgi:large subunit ribosomal protein L15
MKLNSLQSKNKKSKKRLGRGIGSTKGKTCGRGHKGQKARSGVAIIGFEGGQMPLQRRVPKFGFNNINRIEYQGVNLDTIQSMVESKKIKGSLDFDSMIKLRLVRKNELVKILGRGELKAKLKISAHKFTASAKAAIEAAGGEAINI